MAIASWRRFRARRATGSGPAARVGETLPARLTRPIGRDDVVSAFSGRLQRRCFIAIVGPGGGASGVDVLATSREPLRAEGEAVHRLPPLETPARSTGLTAAEALTFPAVELFLERAASCVEGFALTDADAPIVADICRRLDGIALAAGRIDAGVTENQPVGTEG